MKWLSLLLVTGTLIFAESSTKCAELARFQLPGAKIEISRAEMVAAGQSPAGPAGARFSLPPHCRVNGIIDRRTGQDGKTYGIHFAIALPDA